MKILKYNIIIMLAIFSLMSCDKDFINENQATEEQILNTKEGLIVLSKGITQHFATSTLSPIVEIPALTTRELGDLSTYDTPRTLVAGGIALPDTNAGIARLWDRLNIDKKNAEDILKNVDAITMESGTASGLKAYAKFIKAMTLGYLIQNFEKAPINSDEDGQAIFSDRDVVLVECINLLESAKVDVSAMSTEFSDTLAGLDLPNMINAFLARFYLFSGDYTNAIDSANNIDLTSQSVWKFDGVANVNPVWDFAVVDGVDTKPQDNFGLLGSYIPEVGDGRINFYLAPSDEVESLDLGGHEVDNYIGFGETSSTDFPVYLPGEMLLIKAEAYAMQDDLANAVTQINLVRTKTDDIFGVNAGLGNWTGDETNKTDILNEIYKNRCIELFMTGMRLEDSRRIHSNFVPSNNEDFISERNRNYYPYPYEEKANNTNCPADPSI